MNDVMRLWCHECGKSAGRVYARGGSWVYEGVERSNDARLMDRLGIRYGPRIKDEWRNRRFTLELPGPGTEGDEVHTSCRGGHDLVADLSELARLVRSGRKSSVLVPMSAVLYDRDTPPEP